MTKHISTLFDDVHSNTPPSLQLQEAEHLEHVKKHATFIRKAIMHGLHLRNMNLSSPRWNLLKNKYMR
jgi:hypothetical protein